MRGPQVMRGYWNRSDETAKVMLPGGWLRDGEVAEAGVAVPVHRYREGVQIGAVLVDGHAVAVADQPSCSRHVKSLKIVLLSTMIDQL